MSEDEEKRHGEDNAYREGMQARRNDVAYNDCPYKSRKMQKAWQKGWDQMEAVRKRNRTTECGG